MTAIGGVADREIRHVVLLMMENHSFDQMLGCLQDVYPTLDGVDINNPDPRYNLDRAGNKVFQTPTDEQQVPRDPNHDTKWVLKQIANNNSGFVTSYEEAVAGTTVQDRQNIMGYYVLGRLPALHELGQNFTVCDHWFSSLPGPTWPNRFFALSGTSSGRVEMPQGFTHPHLAILAQDQVTLFDRLNEAGKSWSVFYYDFPSSLLLMHQRQAANLRRYAPIKAFFEGVRDEKAFPEFALIEPKYFGADQNDDHPPHNVFKAEKLIADVYNAIRGNADLWNSTLFVILYDEHGGFYDHVSPPPGKAPDNHREEWTFDRLGVRVPALLVSPWVEARVEPTPFDHTSLLKYLTDKWGLGPLGARTAEAESLVGALNQQKARQDTVPFIRVSYSTLVPANPDLEADDSSIHHEAIHAFAANLVDEAMGVAVQDITRVAGWWVKFKAGIGQMLLKIGRGLSDDLGRVKRRRIDATTRVARRLIDLASSPPGGSDQGGSRLR
jgi:phospholipase C